MAKLVVVSAGSVGSAVCVPLAECAALALLSHRIDLGLHAASVAMPLAELFPA